MTEGKHERQAANDIDQLGHNCNPGAQVVMICAVAGLRQPIFCVEQTHLGECGVFLAQRHLGPVEMIGHDIRVKVSTIVLSVSQFTPEFVQPFANPLRVGSRRRSVVLDLQQIRLTRSEPFDIGA